MQMDEPLSRDAIHKYIMQDFWAYFPGERSLKVLPNTVNLIAEGGYNDSNLAMVAKKVALYSSETYFVAGSVDRRNVGGDPDSNGLEPMVLYYDDVFEKHVAILMPYLKDGCIHLFAKEWTYIGGEGGSHISFPSDFLPLNFQRSNVMEQITETPRGLRVLLPHLAGISPNTLLQVRREYQEQFQDFQAALSRLLQGRVDDGERLLFELMQEVDHQVRTIDQEMERIRRKKWFESMKLAIVPFPLVLAFAFPSGEVIHAAVEMLGAGSLLSYVNSLYEIHESRRALEQNPFYIAWHLTKKS